MVTGEVVFIWGYMTQGVTALYTDWYFNSKVKDNLKWNEMKFVLKGKKYGHRLTSKESPKGMGCFIILEKEMRRK